jgi:hypothetical protein
MSTAYEVATAEQRWDIGGADLDGAFTIVDILRSTGSDDVWQTYTGHYSAGGSYVMGTGRRDGHDRYLSTAGGVWLAALPSGALDTVINAAMGWVLTATVKDSGSVQPYMYRYIFDTDEWTEVICAPNLGDVTSQAGGTRRFGIFASDLFTGLRAVGAEWRRRLTFEELQSLVANRSTIDFDTLNPDWLADAGDQFASDLTGNGGDLISDVDTTGSVDDPPDGVGGRWSYGLEVPPDAPVNRAAPVVTFATPTPHVGGTLTTSDGGWLKFPTAFEYQWLRTGTPVGGAVADTYVMQPADEGELISCRVRASNDFGFETANSNQVQPRAELLPAAPSTVLFLSEGEWQGRPLRYPTGGEWA